MGSPFDNLEIIDVFGTIREYEKNDWARTVFRGKWYENDPTIEIRTMNTSTQQMGKGGISLTEEEADSLVRLLVDNDFGKLEDLEAAVKKRRKRFTVEEPETLDEETSKDIADITPSI